MRSELFWSFFGGLLNYYVLQRNLEILGDRFGVFQSLLKMYSILGAVQRESNEPKVMGFGDR